jgi:TolB-like protein/DNA-binding winged helix-turn-helix (wHTH) protein
LASSFTFGEFELDAARFELRHRGLSLKLERIPMELLILLAERDGHVVSRQEIVARLWGDGVFVDTEHGINTAIRKIRKALQEDGDRPRFIQTVQGKGYRLVKDGNGGGAVSERSEPTPASSVATMPVARAGSSRRKLLAEAALLALAAGAVALNVGGVRDRLGGSASAARVRSIAVLPLANLSGDPAQDYFADGMTDELITMLARYSSLRVVSRTSAMQYKGASRPIRDIARELGVDAVLEGSVEKAGNRVHVTAQLIRASTDTHLWAQSYDRAADDAFSLPSQLAQTIAREVRLASAPVEAPRPVDPAAHDAYLHGRYFWFSDDYDRSQEYFEKAIELQADYAAAWSGLADAYTVRAVAGLVPPREVMPRAREAAIKAEEQDDTLPEAHNSRAAVYLFGDWDGVRADAESLRALALNPSYAEARHLHSYVLTALNRGQEALEEQRRSTEIDPFARPWALGLALIRARRFEAAVQDLQMRAQAQPQDRFIRFFLAMAYWHRGMWKESAEVEEKALLARGDNAGAAAIHRAFESGGPSAVAEWWCERSQAAAGRRYVSPFILASVWARAGKKEETLALLEKAYQEHSAPLVFLQSEPVFDFLHSDERYRAFVKKLGFPLDLG